ncbi:MAG: DUF4832 domain-containing protein [Planctomycetes bacterium]|nr:DUF4832 domain-containing protein [Planctomycetota bacterium]
MSASKNVRWRDVFGPDEVIQRVRPKESHANLPNPHKGTTTFQRFNGDPLFPGLSWDDEHGPETFKPFDGNLKNPQYPDTTISYCRWVWRAIEPQKGKFRWDLIDGALEAARVRGQSLQVRIQPYVQGMPEWYWAFGAKPFPGGKMEGRREPDSNDPLYIQHWSEFIRAFGARYDGHPDMESFDIAYAGPCGETGGNSTAETAEKLVDAYLESFRKTQLVSMLGTHGCAYAAGLAARSAAFRPYPASQERAEARTTNTRPIGWRADCFGDVSRAKAPGIVPDDLCWCHMIDAYPKEVARCGVADAWKTAPITLETCWTVGHWFKQGWDIDWILDQGLKYHLSVFMPKSSFIPDEVREKIDAFNRRMGYRFVLRQMILPLEAKPGQRIAFEMFIDNVGVAPLYRPYRLAFRFRQGKEQHVVLCQADPRAWLPDHTWFSEEIVFPPALQRGEAKVDIGLVDAATLTPCVRFAIEEALPNGWHPMTSMDVV